MSDSLIDIINRNQKETSWIGGESASIRKAIQKAGYDLSKTIDAIDPLTIGPVLPKDVKGARIGDVQDCSGARCLKRTLKNDGVIHVFVGAQVVYLGYSDGRLVRYILRGGGKNKDKSVPKIQDKLMSPAGINLVLSPVPPSSRLKHSPKIESGKGGVKFGTKRGSYDVSPRTYSDAALYRNS